MTAPPIPIVDGHNDTFLSALVHFRKLHKRSSKGHIDVPRLHEAGVEAAVFAVCPTRYRFLIKLFTWYWLRQVKKEKNGLHHVRKFSDFAKAREQGKIGAIMEYEGAGGIDAGFKLLEKASLEGLRVLGITWANTNKFGTGARFEDPQEPTGLTNLGRELVPRAQSLGITIDVSHLNEPSFWDVMEVTTKPVIATHSNARSICDHPRNLTDDQIKAIREKKGTVGINFGMKFLDPSGKKENFDLPMSVFKEHIDHIVKVAGVDTVALGADFDGTSVPNVVRDCTKYPDLLDFLLENGYSNQDVRKLAGENLLRVFKATWD
ncbi:membrane dipeptidase [Candidatus Bathyarchaeota archaeon]|nr:membrane dipeptidase [Candidatus Bathyarchaeota archaeon]